MDAKKELYMKEVQRRDGAKQGKSSNATKNMCQAWLSVRRWSVAKGDHRHDPRHRQVQIASNNNKIIIRKGQFQ